MPAGILYNAQALGNVLAFFAFCRRLHDDDKVAFIQEHSQTFHEYSRMNHGNFNSNPRFIASSQDIARAAMRECDFDAATRTIPHMLEQVCHPGQVIARMLAELSLYVFWVTWRQTRCVGEIELHPVELPPLAYSAQDLALLVCYPAWAEKVPFTQWNLEQMAQTATIFGNANAYKMEARSVDPSNIVACIDTPSDADTERYIYLTLHLYHSVHHNALDRIWIDVAFAYGQGIWFLEQSVVDEQAPVRSRGAQ